MILAIATAINTHFLHDKRLKERNQYVNNVLILCNQEKLKSRLSKSPTDDCKNIPPPDGGRGATPGYAGAGFSPVRFPFSISASG